MLYGETKEQLIERKWVSDVVSKPSESRGKPETSVETPRVEKRAVVYHRGFAGVTLEPYTEHLGMVHLWFFIRLLRPLS